MGNRRNQRGSRNPRKFTLGNIRSGKQGTASFVAKFKDPVADDAVAGRELDAGVEQVHRGVGEVVATPIIDALNVVDDPVIEADGVNDDQVMNIGHEPPNATVEPMNDQLLRLHVGLSLMRLM